MGMVSIPDPMGFYSFSALKLTRVTPLNNFLGPEGDTVTMDEQLLNTEYRVVGRG